MMRKGILAQEGPIVPVSRRDAVHQGEQHRWDTGDTGAAAAERKQALGQPDHQYIPWVLGQVLADESIGPGPMTIDEQDDRLKLLSFPPGDPGGQRLSLLCALPGLGDLGAQMQHIRQSAVGQGKSCIGPDRLGELFFWAKILF